MFEIRAGNIFRQLEIYLNINEINLMVGMIWSFEYKYDRLSNFTAGLGFVIAWTIAYISDYRIMITLNYQINYNQIIA